MKTLILLSILSVANVYGIDFTKRQDGICGEFTGDSNSINYKQNEKHGIWQWVIWNVAFSKNGKNPQVFICSGQVRHFNTGTPLEGIPIFLGDDKSLPQLGGLTDSKGEFSFSVMFDAESKRRGCISIDEKISSIYLYVSGAIQTEYQTGYTFSDKLTGRFFLVKDHPTYQYPLSNPSVDK